MTDTCRYTAGRHLNLLGRARSVTASSAQTEFPITWAYDKDPIRPWMADLGDSPVTVTADLASDDYGNFEGAFAAGVPPGWTAQHTGGLSSQETATHFTAGAAALKLQTNGLGEIAQIYRDYTIAMGEEVRITAKARGQYQSMRIYDVLNRLWWTGSAWSSTIEDAFYGGPGTYQPWVTTVPTTRGQGDEGLLRIYLRLDPGLGGTIDSYFDEVYLHPTWEAGAIIGHNVDPGCPVDLQGSSDGSSFTTVATATYRRPSLYALATARQTTRWARIRITGTNSAAVYAGEVVIAQLHNPGSSWRGPLVTEWVPKQLRQQTPGGRTHVTALSSEIPRRIKLDLDFPTDAIRMAFRDDLALRTNLGEHQALIIPDTAVSDVFFGRLAPAFSTSREALSLWETTALTLEEDGFPTVGLGV